MPATAWTILPITGAADDTARVMAAAVDGFIVWTTSDDDPSWARYATRSARRWCTVGQPWPDSTW
jgi:hypothetical protein